jgi:hypothetical protein
MDEFVNSLDIGRFESTNGLWNDLMLNDPWSVGYVTTLIETKEFVDKEDWENYYYSSGETRAADLSKLSLQLQQKLDDEQLVLKNKNEINQMDWNLKNLNFNYGRTKQQITHKGKILFNTALQKGINITEAECVEAVRFRTICQTWNGVIIRERKTIELLKRTFPSISFVKTLGDFDYEYAVDYQLYNGDKLLCGIQIKPSSYNKSNAPYVLKAKAANKRKNDNYNTKFQVPVFDLIYEKGQILNSQILESIKKLV